MDPIFDRVGRIIRSFGVDTSRRPTDGMSDDERSAFEDLEAELSQPKGAPPRPSGQGPRSFHQQQQQQQQRQDEPRKPTGPTFDPHLVGAYATLGVPVTATWEEVQAAHRSLLKKHHPDRHAGHEANLRKATAMSQKIGEAYQTIKKHLAR